METTSPHPPHQASRRFLIGVGVALLVVAVATLVFQGLRTTGLEAGSPEEAAVGFAKAVLDRDFGTAHDVLTPDKQDECALTSFQTWWGDEATTIVVGNVVERERVATVWMDLRSVDPYDFPFDPLPDYYDQDAWVSLERIDGAWRVTDASYGLMDCARRL